MGQCGVMRSTRNELRTVGETLGSVGETIDQPGAPQRECVGEVGIHCQIALLTGIVTQIEELFLA